MRPVQACVRVEPLHLLNKNYIILEVRIKETLITFCQIPFYSTANVCLNVASWYNFRICLHLSILTLFLFFHSSLVTQIKMSKPEIAHEVKDYVGRRAWDGLFQEFSFWGRGGKRRERTDSSSTPPRISLLLVSGRMLILVSFHGNSYLKDKKTFNSDFEWTLCRGIIWGSY